MDRAYFLKRAEDQLRLGEEATSKRAADAHFELAGRYFDIAFGGPLSSEALPVAPTIAA